MSARKYLLECSYVYSTGITTINNTIIYSVLDEFTGVDNNNISFTYEPLTLTDLSNLTNSQYNERINHFLIYVNIESLNKINQLFTEASFVDATCV